MKAPRAAWLGAFVHSGARELLEQVTAHAAGRVRLVLLEPLVTRPAELALVGGKGRGVRALMALRAVLVVLLGVQTGQARRRVTADAAAREGDALSIVGAVARAAAAVDGGVRRVGLVRVAGRARLAHAAGVRVVVAAAASLVPWGRPLLLVGVAAGASGDHAPAVRLVAGAAVAVLDHGLGELAIVAAPALRGALEGAMGQATMAIAAAAVLGNGGRRGDGPLMAARTEDHVGDAHVELVRLVAVAAGRLSAVKVAVARGGMVAVAAGPRDLACARGGVRRVAARAGLATEGGGMIRLPPRVARHAGARDPGRRRVRIVAVLAVGVLGDEAAAEGSGEAGAAAYLPAATLEGRAPPTCWTGARLDYLLLQDAKGRVSVAAHRTLRHSTCSDHVPIVCDLLVE